MEIYNLLQTLKTSKSVCLIGHLSPDTDALASMIVFKDFLNNYFKIETVDIFTEEFNPDDEYFLELVENTEINPPLKTYDTAIVMDAPNIERLGIYKELFKSASKKIVIDHHATNDNSGDINIVEMRSSTCEIVYSILSYFNYQIPDENKGKLYAGIITDTNNFTVGNFDNRTFRIASEIVDDINKNDIYQHFLANNSLSQMRMLSVAIQNLKTFENGKIIISHVEKEDIQSATLEDCSGIINKLATISGSKLICFIYPKTDGYYVSMRAKEGFDVASIAKQNGGGGHTGAAAYLSHQNLESIQDDIIVQFTQQLKQIARAKKRLFYGITNQ